MTIRMKHIPAAMALAGLAVAGCGGGGKDKVKEAIDVLTSSDPSEAEIERAKGGRGGACVPGWNGAAGYNGRGGPRGGRSGRHHRSEGPRRSRVRGRGQRSRRRSVDPRRGGGEQNGIC